LCIESATLTNFQTIEGSGDRCRGGEVQRESLGGRIDRYRPMSHRPQKVLVSCNSQVEVVRHTDVLEDESDAFKPPTMYQRPPLWSSGQTSWLQIQRSGFYSRRYQILLEVAGLERGPLSLVSTTEELLGRKSSGSGLENR
jgi:hypothetical protein